MHCVKTSSIYLNKHVTGFEMMDSHLCHRRDNDKEKSSTDRALSSDKITIWNFISICLWTGIDLVDIHHASLQNKVNPSKTPRLV